MSLPAEHRATPGGKPRARGLGVPFTGRPGRWNAITDVPGIEVGYVTLVEGQSVLGEAPGSRSVFELLRMPPLKGCGEMHWSPCEPPLPM